MGTKPPGSRETADFDLHSFFPYLVRIYYRAVSSSITDIYASRYGLSVSEWRTMAVLGTDRISATDIVARSSMNKVNVSRAINGLREAGYLRREIDDSDRRRAVLRLTDDGLDVLRTLIPLVREREAQLLSGLTDAERAALVRLMEKVRSNAAAL